MSVTAVPLQPVKRSYIVWLWLGIIAAVVAACLLAWQASAKSTDSGLRYMAMEQGTGEHPTDDDVALVTYVGRLPNGEVFDRSERPVPMPVSGVVPGFSEGLKLMRKGARYRLWIPADLGYGAKSPDPSTIPPNSDLIFDVQLLEFIPQQMYQQMMQMQMMRGGGAGQGMPPTGQ
ncbi:FKBP-type peptidyl-prolyl cis-trans isomerase [Stakelama saccharophila]|uniref:Peptidyl-prolyl cis-trans isomerase n=1 Tax=Stakelama saccharophila TaxID=3075605 RepID=A0ABZ0B6I9_9SPHN|nr:FKBP-type peptidyl-prolyl cis-trans isomerase [Stakelama sp. W311]WNO53015.1 FKBP-type peptidyl-prolyl cis-trans isomerase [Stakelama sp. W311]